MSWSIDKYGNLKSEYLLNPGNCSSFTFYHVDGPALCFLLNMRTVTAELIFPNSSWIRKKSITYSLRLESSTITLFQFSPNMRYVHIQWYLTPGSVDFKYSFAFISNMWPLASPSVPYPLCSCSPWGVWVSVRSTTQSHKVLMLVYEHQCCSRSPLGPKVRVRAPPHRAGVRMKWVYKALRVGPVT